MLGLRHLAGRISAIRRFNTGVASTSTPQNLGTTDGVLRYIDRSGRENSSISFELLFEPNEDPALTLNYVDDVNIGETHDTANAVSTFSQNKEQKFIHAASKVSRSLLYNNSKYGMHRDASKLPQDTTSLRLCSPT